MSMKCLFCPVIQGELKNRINNFIVWEGYFPDKGELEWDIIANCWCDKTGYKIWDSCCDDMTPYQILTEEEYEDFCEINNYNITIIEEDNNEEEIQEIDPVPEVTKRQNKRARDKRYKNKLKRMWQYTKNWYPSPAYPIDKNGEYADTEEETVTYKRQYSPRRSKYLRKLSNKKVRRKKGISNRGGYRKVFDYQWELW